MLCNMLVKRVLTKMGQPNPCSAIVVIQTKLLRASTKFVGEWNKPLGTESYVHDSLGVT